MEQTIMEIINNYGYLGIFLLITLENIFPPIPSEVILLFGGFMTTCSGLEIYGVVLVATAGSLAGAIILYQVSSLLDAERLERIVDRWGHILRLRRQDIQRADRWFDRYGVWTVFFCRLVPILRSLVSIPAGMSHMNFGKFILFTTAGTLIWNTILVHIGAVVGASWESVVGYWDIYSHVVFVILGLLLAAVIIRRLLAKK